MRIGNKIKYFFLCNLKIEECIWIKSTRIICKVCSQRQFIGKLVLKLSQKPSRCCRQLVEVSIQQHGIRMSTTFIETSGTFCFSGGALRLVQTRRPITPQVKQRHLYGKEQAPAGRPPSAFSLKYLQYETRALPCLEPIKTAVNSQLLANNLAVINQSTSQNQNQIPNQIDEKVKDKSKVHRSGSVGSLMPTDNSCGDRGKLPALLNIPQGSHHDDCEYFFDF